MIRNVRTFLVEKTFFISLEKRKKQERLFTKKGRLSQVITLSRQHGCYGAETALELQKLLGAGWLVFHREILEAIAKDTGVEKKYLKQFDEKTIPLIEEIVNGFTSPYITDHTYLVSLRKFFNSLAERGKVIIIGRGANFILKEGFHLRLVAPQPIRIRNLMAINKYGKSKATEELEEADSQRKSFISKLFHADVEDSLNYDLVINTKNLSFKEAAKLIFDASKTSALYK
ncbi:MAG: cytidylate kinase-like family protein [Patescibacteria group bacterium]|nr:cytidylate kinase-like family protein [Patescibacteria group bacterium]